MPNLDLTDEEHAGLVRLVKKTLVAVHPGEGPLTERRAVVQPARREPLFMFRVFGRLPVTDSATHSRVGVRKASGEETAGEFALAVVSVYGDLASM
jgi:hypothetical protein